MLSNEENDVTVITGIPNYPDGKIPSGYGFFTKRREVLEGIKVKRLWLIPRGSGSKPRMILNYLSYFISSLIYTLYISLFKKKYDVIFVHHTSPIFITISPIIYKWLRKPKMILWDLDMWPDTLVALDIIKSKKMIQSLESLVKWIYKKYDKILIGSNSFAEKAKIRVASSKVEYFPNWAEDIFIEGKLLVPDNKPVFPAGFTIMYTGNIGEAQDFENVSNAMILLKDKDITWLIVGGGRWQNKLKEKISKEGITNEVIFYGNNPIKTMPYFFSKADVVFLSLQNKDVFTKTVPAKLQAYMGAGKPIVGMISGEGNQIIKQANCGIAVESGDYEGFANAILKISKEKDKLNDYGRNGLKFYNENFSKHTRQDQLRKIINS